MRLADHLSSAPRGSGRRIAAHVGVTPGAISQWAAGTKSCPVERCALVERATGGAVRVEDLRPDVVWARVPDPSWPNTAGRPLPDFSAAVLTACEAA
jgi:DNA-binding transcriptional regulator YdaS (Cro superfamily)